jgi:hypothetical protein
MFITALSITQMNTVVNVRVKQTFETTQLQEWNCVDACDWFVSLTWISDTFTFKDMLVLPREVTTMGEQFGFFFEFSTVWRTHKIGEVPVFRIDKVEIQKQHKFDEK